MLCAPLSMLGSPSRTGCDGVRFPVPRDWNSRDSMAGMCDCVKSVYSVCISHINLWCLVSTSCQYGFETKYYENWSSHEIL